MPRKTRLSNKKNGERKRQAKKGEKVSFVFCIMYNYTIAIMNAVSAPVQVNISLSPRSNSLDSSFTTQSSSDSSITTQSSSVPEHFLPPFTKHHGRSREFAMSSVLLFQMKALKCKPSAQYYTRSAPRCHAHIYIDVRT